MKKSIKHFPYRNALITSFLWIGAVQALFYLLHRGSILDLEGILVVPLRQDIIHFNFENMAQSINDLEGLKLIKCTTLKTQNASIPIIDSSSKNCTNSFLLNFQTQKTYTLPVINGNTYHLSTFIRGSKSFAIALWLSRIFGVVLCFLLSFFYQARKRKNQELLKLRLNQLKMMEEKATIKQEQATAVDEVARQVSHDIRSPLTALNVALHDIEHMPERHRVLVRNAVNRIHDIANTLLKKNTSSQKRQTEQTEREKQDRSLTVQETQEKGSSLELLSSLVSLVIAEKRMQFRSHMGVEIDFILNPSSYGLFARVEAEGLKRILSNFINNSVEALPHGRGSIKVSFFLGNEGEDGDGSNGIGKGEMIHLCVKDNGAGIPSDVLSKLGKEQITYGKKGTQSGSGIGVYSAEKMLKAWGGKLQIQSELKKGSSFFILLPKEKPPKWFVPQIEIHPNMKILILDDDTSIHEIWRGRFESKLKSVPASSSVSQFQSHFSSPSPPSLSSQFKSNKYKWNIECLHFSSAEKFKNWHQQNKTKEILCLMDYELLGQGDTGLDIIEELHLSDKAILITSRFDEAPLRERCKKLQVKLIPKELARLVPIVFQEKISPHAILIDDDVEFIHTTWQMKAKQKGKELYCFTSVEAFLNKCESFDKKVPIYVDSHLGNHIKGEVEAEKIFHKGFQEIYLATGDMVLKEKVIPNTEPFSYIKKILGKDPIW